MVLNPKHTVGRNNARPSNPEVNRAFSAGVLMRCHGSPPVKENHSSRRQTIIKRDRPGMTMRLYAPNPEALDRTLEFARGQGERVSSLHALNRIGLRSYMQACANSADLHADEGNYYYENDHHDRCRGHNAPRGSYVSGDRR